LTARPEGVPELNHPGQTKNALWRACVLTPPSGEPKNNHTQSKPGARLSCPFGFGARICSDKVRPFPLNNTYRPRRDNAIIAWHEVQWWLVLIRQPRPWESTPQKNRPVGYGMIRAQLIPGVFLVVMDRFLNLRDTASPNPTGRPFRDGAVPGDSCQATIAPPSRDISQQALARIRGPRIPTPFTSFGGGSGDRSVAEQSHRSGMV
jgi:hypothetical protein